MNAYNALTGAMKNDRKAMEEANLPRLLNELEKFADEWRARMERNMYARLKYELVSVREVIQSLMKD